MVSSDFADFFNELLFGSGSYLGLILLVIFMLVITLSWKYGGVLTTPMSLIFAWEYVNHDLIWQCILMLSFTIFGLFTLNKELKH